jgi:lipid-A-disaccharide synthase
VQKKIKSEVIATTSSLCDIYLVAGEPSGDLHGAHLAAALQKKAPHQVICGIAGEQMRRLSIHGICPMEDLQAMGFTDVVAAVPRLARRFFQIRNEILALQPKAVICIDYPGFNLRLAASLRKKGYQGKLVHYICPAVWAWGKSRIPAMAENLDLLITLLPFEAQCFSQTRLPVVYAGHPLVQIIEDHKPSPCFKTMYRIDSERPIIAIFPGSRPSEIKNNFPVQLEAARRLQSHTHAIIAISLAHPRLRSRLTVPGVLLIEPEHRYDLMRHARLALATSGTVTLELALCETPTVVNYAIRPFDRFLIQYLFRVHLPFYSLPNIILQKPLFPELFGLNLNADAIVFHGQALWGDAPRAACQSLCRSLKEILGNTRAAEIAADASLKLLDF